MVINTQLDIKAKSNYLGFLLPESMTSSEDNNSHIFLFSFLSAFWGKKQVGNKWVRNGRSCVPILAVYLTSILKFLAQEVEMSIIQKKTQDYDPFSQRGYWKNMVAKRFELLHLSIPENSCFLRRRAQELLNQAP